MADFLKFPVDLLSTQMGEPLLLCGDDLPLPPAAILFDHETREVGIEFQNSAGYFGLNIPVDDDHFALLKNCGRVYLVSLSKDNKVSTISVLQLYHQAVNEDDLFIPNFQTGLSPIVDAQSTLAQAKRAQPLHRPEIAAGGSLAGVLFGRGIESAKTLGLTARLQHELNSELEMRRQVAPNFTPRMAPPGLGPQSNSMNTLTMNNYRPKPPSFPHEDS